MSAPTAPDSFKVYVRWRPLVSSERDAPEIEHNVVEHGSQQSISLSASNASNSNAANSRTKHHLSWKSGASFTQVFLGAAANHTVYADVVKPALSRVLKGATCNLFAYGHSGSGKTHTIIGYDHQHDENLGLYLATARDLFTAINEINIDLSNQEVEDAKDQQALAIAVRVYEIRGKYAYDLLNNNTECHVREGYDGQTHIRGQTEMLDDGKVRVRPIGATPCWNFEDLLTTVSAALGRRAIGSSSVHDESSRTHAFIELEIVNKKLIELRDIVIERESELVPVAKRATDIYLEEQMKSLMKTEDGQYIQNPDCPLNQEVIDEAEAKKSEYEARVKAAEGNLSTYLDKSKSACLGGKFVFVDLAGSEYFNQDATKVKQTPQERQQGRQINTDLFALKEVIRARALNQARIPFRSSPLTMVLRNHFGSKGDGQSAMILTVSPSEEQFAATVNTLKYGNLVGVAGGNKKA